MEPFGDFFPGNPQTLDELLEQFAAQMAAVQAALDSMSPEQRAQLQALAESLFEDMDLRWQMDRLAENLRQAVPGAGWGRRYRFSGSDPMGLADAAASARRLGEMDQLEQFLRSATSPGALAEVDLDAGGQVPGRRRGPLPRRPGPSGQAARGGRPHRAARGPLRAHRPGHPPHRPAGPDRPVLQAGQGPPRRPPQHLRGHRPRARGPDQALRVRRPLHPRHPAHHAQRRDAGRARARRCTSTPTTSRSRAPST